MEGLLASVGMSLLMVGAFGLVYIFGAIARFIGLSPDIITGLVTMFFGVGFIYLVSSLSDNSVGYSGGSTDSYSGKDDGSW